jgi:hypothetical protein
VLLTGLSFMAFRAEKVGDNVFDDENLLQNGRSENFLLDSQLHLQTLAMRFSPNEVGIDQSDFVESLDTTHAVREELTGLQLAGDPSVGRLVVTTASFTPRDGNLLGNALCNIDLRSNAVDAHVCGVRRGDLESRKFASNAPPTKKRN